MPVVGRSTAFDRDAVGKSLEWALALKGSYEPHLVKFLAIWVEHSRFFRAGDVVVGVLNNGGAERFPVWGWSSRIGSVNGVWVQFVRFQRNGRFNETNVRTIEVRDLVEPSRWGTLQDPALRSPMIDRLLAAGAPRAG